MKDTKPIDLYEYFTVQEAADLLRVHTQTVKNWIRAGHVKVWRATPTSTIRIPKSEIQRHVQ